MLSNDDQSGIFTFMVGMIVLVLAGVGLSIVVDKRLSFSSTKMSAKREIAEDKVELESLLAKHEELSKILERSTSVKADRAGSPGEISKMIEIEGERLAVLKETREQLKREISRFEDDFSKYREQFRYETWSKAAGERLGDLTLLNGRKYREVIISKVTNVGLEIRHSYGFARIQAPELDQTLQERFQWNDEERLKVLNHEAAQLDGIAKELEQKASDSSGVNPENDGVNEVSKSSDSSSDEMELASLRRLVVGWKSRVSKLKFERLEALNNSGFGSQSSVPGSLETWTAKSARLANELVRANAELAVAKSKLAAVAPDDPLLRPDPPSR